MGNNSRRGFGKAGIISIILLVAIISITFLLMKNYSPRDKINHGFDSQRAMHDVEFQVSLGPRTPGSQAHEQVIDYIKKELMTSGWEVNIQETETMGHPVKNLIARWGQGRPWIVLGAHFDTRLLADRDPITKNRTSPVPGANDGASGVAVLLEMGRVIPDYMQQKVSENSNQAGEIWLVFFDAEDNGKIPGWDWILGSRAFVESLDTLPDAAIIVDMIGDRDLNIYKEKNSHPFLTNRIWDIAAELGYSDQFIPLEKHSILDDHLPFVQAGVPAVDIIDIEYPYYHTTGDLPDKVSALSLKIVGDVLLSWLVQPGIDALH